MVWLWSSFEEYQEQVAPVVLNRVGTFKHTQSRTWFEAQRELHLSFDELGKKNEQLRKLVFASEESDRVIEDPVILDVAHRLLVDIAHAGENLLLHHQRLARSRFAYGFISQHGILEHWERYCSEKRIYWELARLVEDTDELLVGYRDLHADDESFLTDGLDLPTDLKAEFRTARNLFSVGFDEAGLLLAARGLEGVLRRIARTRKLVLHNKGKDTPGYEADLHDLIELTFRIQWKSSEQRLISPQTRALLHYLRTLRNGEAHADSRERTATLNPRETATVVATVAGQLWREVSTTRARFTSTVVVRNW